MLYCDTKWVVSIVYVNYMNTTWIQYIFKGQKTHLPNPGKVWNPHHCGDIASVNKQVYYYYLIKQCKHLHIYSMDWRGTSSESDRERGHWNGNSTEVVCGLQSTSVTNKQIHTTVHIWKHLVQLHSFRRCKPKANTVHNMNWQSSQSKLTMFLLQMKPKKKIKVTI